MFGRIYNKVAERAATKMYAKLTEEKKEKKESVFKQLLKSPDDFVMQAWVEGEEVRVKFFKKGEQKNETNS